MASGTDGIQLNNLVNPSHRQSGSDREISSRNLEAGRLSSIAPTFFQFVRQRPRVVNFSQRFRDCRRINADSARLFVGENAIEHERLNVAVEIMPTNSFTLFKPGL